MHSGINARSMALSSSKRHLLGGRGFADHTSSCHTAGAVWRAQFSFTTRVCMCFCFPLDFWFCHPRSQSALPNPMKTSAHLGRNVFPSTAHDTDKKIEVYSIWRSHGEWAAHPEMGLPFPHQRITDSTVWKVWWYSFSRSRFPLTLLCFPFDLFSVCFSDCDF